MAQQTGIEWTDMSANPIRAVRKDNGKRGHACVHASPGCIHCYSERWNGWRGTGFKFNVPSLSQVDIILDEKELARMRKIKAGNKVFVCDMTDLFGPFVPDEYIVAVWAAMCDNQGAAWQVLTKRPERMAALLNNGDFWVEVALAMSSKAPPVDFPAPHIWLGTSVETQEYADKRIPHLLRVPTRVRFLSCEPLLGPIDLGHACPCGYYCDESVGHVDHAFWTPGIQPGIHWCIVGGESGRGARPMHPDWARSLRDQCQAAGVAFFFKQWGEWLPMVCERDENRVGHFVGADGRRIYIADLLAHAHEIKDDRGIIRLGKKAAGRLLDGAEWNQFPDEVIV